MTFTITLDRDEDGVWVVECPAIPGCVSQGKTREEAIETIKDAIKLCLEVRAERGMPLTIEIDDEEFEGEVALVRQNQELMEFLDRRSEASNTYTIEQARKLLGIDRSE
jgi:predicted RNase H-like HicB family nuclease